MRLRPLARRIAALACSGAFVVLSWGGPVAPVQASPALPLGQVVGNDISWPNCPTGMGIPSRPTLGLPMPDVASRYAVLGLTNGPAFTPNPCLATQAAWARDRHLWTSAYAVVSYPTAAQLAAHGGTGTLAERLRRVGRAQARATVTTMRAAGLSSPMVWVDVEPVPGVPWSSRTANNNAVVDGAMAQYRAQGYAVGLYSYAYGWKQITGGRQLPALPTWVPGGAGKASAFARCSQRSFSGGPVLLGQWVSGGRDYDLTCPGVTGSPARMHPLTAYTTVRLARGARGKAVVALQRRLKLTPDGRFGARTKAAVARTQRAHGFAATGVVTAPMWRVLGAGTTVSGGTGWVSKVFSST
jgi:Putative peptidoglycan binding domain